MIRGWCFIKMQQQILKQSAEYNEIVGDVFSKIQFTSFRNSPHILWMQRGATNLNEVINTILEVDTLTPSEKQFLIEIQNLIRLALKKKDIVIIAKSKAKSLLIVSINSMVERDLLVKKDILNEIDFKEFKEALFLLEANARLLELVKNKLMDMSIRKEDFNNIKEVANSLVKTYLFLIGEISKEYIIDSLKNVKSIWRYYHPLSEIIFE